MMAMSYFLNISWFFWSDVRADQDKLLPTFYRLIKEEPRSLGNAKLYTGERCMLDET